MFETLKMKPQLLFLIVTLFFISCKTEVKTSDSLLSYLPSDSQLILKINNLSNFKSELKNSTFLKETSGFPIHEKIKDKLNQLTHVTTDETCVLAFYEIGKENYEFVLISKKRENLFNLEGVANKTIETLNYEGRTIIEYSFEDSKVFGTEENGLTILSSSKMLAENMVRAGFDYTIDDTLTKLYETSSPEKSASVFLNLNGTSSFITTFKKEEDKKKPPFSDWMSLDFSANSDNIHLNGIGISSDSTKSFINLFKGTKPLTNKTPLIAPLNAKAILSYSFDDYQVFAKNQNTYLDRTKRVDSLFNTIEEVGIIYLSGKKIVLLNSFGAESLSEFLSTNKTSSSTYQGSEIMALRNTSFLEEGFNPLLPGFTSNFCAILENTFLFAEEKGAMQAVISSYKSSSSFNDAPFYKTAVSTLASESTILFVSNDSGINDLAKNDLNPDIAKAIDKASFENYSFATQVVSDNNFAHINLLASKVGKTKAAKTVSPLFTLELETDLANIPQFVKNHRTNKQEIVVQDQNNFLYLISTDGKVLWKKQLDGRIQGDIKQVDIYKNGRLQLAFCTSNQFFILDRNGEIVPPFNKTFEGGNLNELAVFDYEGKKDYRFVVTQGEKVFMYNNKANIVDGFTYTKAQSPIIKAPKHFRISNRDYLVFQLEDKSLKILHRAGGERLKISQKIDFSDNETFLYKNKFSITNKKGVLHQIDTKGKLTSTDFNLNKDHGMYATSNTLVFMDDNVLSIRGKKVELELGVYTKPKIFYIYDKIYVGVTDIQNQKIYLFDSQAVSIPNFPVYGSSLIDLTDMDNDKKLEIVAKDQENSIIVYGMN